MFRLDTGHGPINVGIAQLRSIRYANYEINYHVVGTWSRVKGLSAEQAHALFNTYTLGKSSDGHQ